MSPFAAARGTELAPQRGVRGRTALATVFGAGLAAFALAGAANYAEQACRQGGPRAAAEWAARAVRPPGPLPAGRGAELFERYRCFACHRLEGHGGSVGPALDGVRGRKSRAEILEWLADPQAIRPGTSMPRFPLTPLERELLADYLLAK